MKKFIFSAIAAIGLLLSPSCSDENEVLSGSDNEALVSFSVNLADGISTKASGDYTIGKGQKVNKLRVLVYESASNAVDGAVDGHISDLDKKEDIAVGTPKTVSFSLVKGKTYHFLFWAQYENDAEAWKSPYTLGDDGTVTIDYSNNGSTSPLSNDERYDAFVATETRTITTDISFDVKLTRPFAQLNFLTTAADIKKAAAGRIIPGIDFSGESLKSEVKINNVATKLNPFTKTVSGSQSVTFEASATPFTITHNSGVTTYTADDFEVEAVGTGNTVSITPSSGTATDYYYLATNYFLVYTGDNGDASTNATLTSAELEIDGSDYSALVIPNIPVKQNYRTNIYGNLLTAGGTFNVEIDNGFGGNINNNVVITPDEMIEAIESGTRVFNLTVTDDGNTIYVPKVFETGNSETLTFNVTNNTTNGATIVYEDISTGAIGTLAPAKVIIKSSGNWNITLPESMVTLFGTGGGDGKTMGDITGDGSKILLPVGYNFGTVTMSSGKLWNYAGAAVTGNPPIIDGSYFVGANGYQSGGLRFSIDLATIADAIEGGYRHWTLMKNISESNTLDDYYYINLNGKNLTGTLKLTGSNQITFKNSVSSESPNTVTIDKSEFKGELIIGAGVTVTDENGQTVISD